MLDKIDYFLFDTSLAFVIVDGKKQGSSFFDFAAIFRTPKSRARQFRLRRRPGGFGSEGVLGDVVMSLYYFFQVLILLRPSRVASVVASVEYEYRSTYTTHTKKSLVPSNLSSMTMAV